MIIYQSDVGCFGCGYNDYNILMDPVMLTIDSPTVSGLSWLSPFGINEGEQHTDVSVTNSFVLVDSSLMNDISIAVTCGRVHFCSCQLWYCLWGISSLGDRYFILYSKITINVLVVYGNRATHLDCLLITRFFFM